MRAFADDEDIAAHAAGAEPVPEQPIGPPEAIDPGRVEQVAAGLVIGIEQRGRLRHRQVMSAVPMASTETGLSTPGIGRVRIVPVRANFSGRPASGGRAASGFSNSKARPID